MTKSATFIIPAYDSAEWIPDLLFGLQNQAPVPGWEIDFSICCDACEKTSKKLKDHGVSHYQAVKNSGHAIIRNSLLAIKKSDLYLYFDADDQPFKSYAKICIEQYTPGTILMTGKVNTDSRLVPRNGNAVVENGGAMVFDNSVLEKIGGFAPFRCAIDTDFMRRAEMAGIEVQQLKKAMYYRRSHGKALTKNPVTGMRSDFRKKQWAEMTSNRQKGIYKIEPVTVELKEIKI